MEKSSQLAIEVHFVPLPSDEIEERSSRLRALLVRGAIRFVREQENHQVYSASAEMVAVSKFNSLVNE